MRFSKLTSLLLLSSLLGLVSSLTTERIASACGGCFVPPENNTVVTDHRMILAVGSTETTLYDQIRYQGSPESFAWVLPIRGEAKVGVSSDAVFGALDEISRVRVVPPPANCPSSGVGCGSASLSSATSADNPVTVLRQETVGPYETVQLRSSDPGALNKWLSEKGYRVTPEMEPVIANYVAEKFDFLALKLVPGQSVKSMKPVRVSTPGASPVLPLRMVAAGAGASVGITLWTLGDGRWEPGNFPKFVVNEKDLVWNWAESASNFKALRAKFNGDLGGSAWEMESSISVNTSTLRASIRTIATTDRASSPQTYYEPILPAEYPVVKDANGTVVASSEENFADDMGHLFGNKPNIRVTRMRADLPQASLASDLVLQASVDQGILPVTRNVTQEADEPLCRQDQDAGCSTTGDSNAELAGVFAVVGATVMALRRKNALRK